MSGGPNLRRADRAMTDQEVLQALERGFAGRLATIGKDGYGSAYFAEIYRSGIQSIERGQWEAARALGFGYFRQMRYIVMPQALRRMIPAFTNEAIELFKLTSIASTIAYAELLYDAKMLSDLEYRPVEAYTAIAFIFIGILFIFTFGSRRLERYLAEKHGQ